MFLLSTIISLLAPDKFNSANVAVPRDFSIRFVTPYSESAVITACKEGNYLFSPASAGKITAGILSNIPTIRLVQTMGVGFDHIDIAASRQIGVPVANMPAANAVSVAEQTLGLLIALQRRLLESDAAIKQGNYSSFRNAVLSAGLQEIYGSRVGLIGFGNIARAVARIFLTLGAKVSYFTPRRQSADIERQYSVEYKELDELLASSDVISLHLPLNEKTRGLIGARELSLIAQGSFLLNTARGEILDQKALADCLEAGHLAGAALDTVSPEPPDSRHPLLQLSATASARLLLTPHTAGVTLGAYKRMIEGALRNMSRIEQGRLPENIVNGIFARA